METVGTQTINIVPMDSYESLARLADAVYNDPTTDVSRETINEWLFSSFVFGYEALLDGVAVGWSYCTLIGGGYFLDGCNIKVNPFIASKMGKMICEDLRNIYNCKIVLTYHKEKEKHATVLAKRIGFQRLFKLQDTVFFYKAA